MKKNISNFLVLMLAVLLIAGCGQTSAPKMGEKKLKETKIEGNKSAEAPKTEKTVLEVWLPPLSANQDYKEV